MARTKLLHRTYRLPVDPKIGTTIFYIAFALYLVYILIISTGYGAFVTTQQFDFPHLLRLIIWGFLGIKLLLQRYNITQFFIVSFLVLLVFATWLSIGLGLEIFLFVAAGQNIKIRRLSQIVLCVVPIGSLFTIISSLVGVIENVQVPSDYSSDLLGRNSLGFLNPNIFAAFIFSSVLAWLVVNYQKLSIVNAIVVFVGAFIVFTVSESETFTIAILLAGCIHILSHKLPARLLAVGGFLATLIISGFSLYAMIAFNKESPLWTDLDSYLSYRVRLPHYYFENFPNTLFGQNFESAFLIWLPAAKGHLLVDNLYCLLWLKYGIVAAIVFIALLLLLFVKSFRENRWNEATFGVLLLIFIGFVEATPCRFDIGYFLVAFSTLIFSTSLQSLEMPHTTRHSRKKEKEEAT